mmetsp:Transcript_50345/g.93091  ORF Transcript_50345/g.93091 Transcript_50345/m.93091 type:complete len:305 (+) Transcript_50345:70-984(+)
MRTIKAAVATVGSSPARLGASITGVGTAVLAVIGTFLSSTLVDNVLLMVILLLIISAVYLQTDWAVAMIEWYSPEVVFRMPTKEQRAALTIDDVPLLDAPTHFEQILDVLKANNVKATFFIMSGFNLPALQGGMDTDRAAHCKKLLKRAVDEGHELGNHLQFDKPAFALTREEFDEAFKHCDSLIASLQGGEDAWKKRKHRWFRPSSGLWTDHILATASKAGYKTVLGNCFPHDVAAVSRHFNPTYLKFRIRPGSVVVVHDRWHTPNTLQAALPVILSTGMSLGTLSSLRDAVDASSPAEQKRD